VELEDVHTASGTAGVEDDGVPIGPPPQPSRRVRRHGRVVDIAGLPAEDGRSFAMEGTGV